MSGKSLGETLYLAMEITPIEFDMRGPTVRERYETAAAAVVAAHEAGKWRKVEDGLPEKLPNVHAFDGGASIECLVCGPQIDRVRGRYLHDAACWQIDGHHGSAWVVTHWAALPAPPEGGTR